MSLNVLKQKYHYPVLFAIFCLLIFQYFYGIYKYHYPVPPGDDSLRHMTAAKEIIDTGEVRIREMSFDPPLLRILLAALSEINNLNIITVTKYFIPGLAVLTVFSIYFLVNRYFNDKKLATISVIICAILLPQPWRIYEDGTYDNLISASYLFLYALAFFPGLIKNSSTKIDFKTVGLFTIFSASVLLSHSMSAIYLLLTLTVTALFLIIRFRKKIFLRRNLLLAYLLILVFIPFVWNFYLADIWVKTLNLIGITEINGRPNILTADFSQNVGQVPVLNEYYWHLTPLIIWLGLLGLIFLSKFRPDRPYEKWLLFFWLGILYTGSRSEFFQLPTRFARDMYIPLTILASIFIIFFLAKCTKLIRFATLLVLYLIISLNLIGNINIAKNYNALVRVQDSDLKAINWIKTNTQQDDTIIVVPRTIISGDWGSFINLFTNRETLDGTICPPDDDARCDPIYDPNSEISRNYYRDNSIDYVYAGKSILGSFIAKDKIDWTYQKTLAQADFLMKKAEFFENKSLGSVIIYKVDHQKLNE